MDSFLLVLIIIGLLFILGKSAKMIEGTFVLIARTTKISNFIIGFVILSIITSLPEISIAIASSQNIPQLSLGNEIGSTAILLTLVVGINAVRFKKIKFKGQFAEKEILIGIASIFLMLLTILDRYISVVEGGSMLLIYIIYILYLNYKFTRKISLKQTMINASKVYTSLGTAVLGMVILVLASSFIVKAAISLSFNLGISPALIGVFLLAIGTNVPELTIAMTTRIKNDEKDLSVGNVLGSVCLNPGTVGLLAILAGGIKINDLVSLTPSLVISFLAVFLFAIFSYTGKTLSRIEGYILIGVYFSLVITEIILLLGRF